MRRTLSANRTGLLKVSACLWAAALAIVTLTLFWIGYAFPEYARTTFGTSLPWKFLIAWPIIAVFVYYYYVPLKDVALEVDSVVVSTSGQSAVIPLVEIETVRQSRWLNTEWRGFNKVFRRVIIEFRDETLFGRSVMFVPEVSSEAIIAELRAAVAAAVRH